MSGVLADLVKAVEGASHRFCAGIPCYCRPPQPNAQMGHEENCKRLYRAYQAAQASLEATK